MQKRTVRQMAPAIGVVLGAFLVTSLAIQQAGGGNLTTCRSSRSDMICIPAGSFTMGSLAGDQDEEPVHKVYLDEYLIDKHEVTFEEYGRCVQAGRCKRPRYALLSKKTAKSSKKEEKSKGGEKKRSTSEKVTSKVDPRFPVVGIDWHNAEKYCVSLGKRLPTEAEWEKAARGTDSRRYPWGNRKPTCKLANIDLCGQNLLKVESKPSGASPYGVHDMTGNVWEWVSDWYDEKYYFRPEALRNPPGPVNETDPTTGQLKYRYKILRGGSYTGTPSPLWASYRFRLMPNTKANDIGFRCAMTVSKSSQIRLDSLKYAAMGRYDQRRR